MIWTEDMTAYEVVRMYSGRLSEYDTILLLCFFKYGDCFQTTPSVYNYDTTPPTYTTHSDQPNGSAYDNDWRSLPSHNIAQGKRWCRQPQCTSTNTSASDGYTRLRITRVAHVTTPTIISMAPTNYPNKYSPRTFFTCTIKRSGPHLIVSLTYATRPPPIGTVG